MMDLVRLVKKLDRIFKLPLAESWDNVGLLVQPSAPMTVSRICLTNDLTEPVLDEAISTGSNFIISYHPPIFRPLKRLTQNAWKERIIIKCLENKIAVYSPHTALDAVAGGVNDWLLSPFGTTPLFIIIFKIYFIKVQLGVINWFVNLQLQRFYRALSYRSIVFEKISLR